MTPLETEANPNIRVGPLRWGRPPIATHCRLSLILPLNTPQKAYSAAMGGVAGGGLVDGLGRLPI